MLELYQNKEWLEKKYLGEKLSIRQIGKEVNRHHETIRQWLKKCNIPRRFIGEGVHLALANHCKLSQEAIEWLNGELLGDGGLWPQSSYSAFFIYCSKYLEYIKYISNVLTFSEIESSRIYKYYHKKYNCYSYHLTSRNYAELSPIRKQWYPNGKKIVPKDLKLTSLTCRQWFIGDGNINYQKSGKAFIRLYTNGFSIGDVEWLTDKINKLGFKATRRPSENTIRISIYSTKDFLNYIGKCPVKCYEYKWRLQCNNKT